MFIFNILYLEHVAHSDWNTADAQLDTWYIFFISFINSIKSWSWSSVKKKFFFLPTLWDFWPSSRQLLFDSSKICLKSDLALKLSLQAEWPESGTEPSIGGVHLQLLSSSAGQNHRAQAVWCHSQDHLSWKSECTRLVVPGSGNMLFTFAPLRWFCIQ